MRKKNTSTDKPVIVRLVNVGGNIDGVCFECRLYFRVDTGQLVCFAAARNGEGEDLYDFHRTAMPAEWYSHDKVLFMIDWRIPVPENNFKGYKYTISTSNKKPRKLLLEAQKVLRAFYWAIDLKKYVAWL